MMDPSLALQACETRCSGPRPHSTEAQLTRRDALRGLAAGMIAQGGPDIRTANRLFRPYLLTPFAADVTPPLGHPCMGGGIAPARTIVDPLEATASCSRAATLAARSSCVAVDWCEIRNDAYDRWREALAEAAGTDPQRVLVTRIHQHDAPIADLDGPAAARDEPAHRARSATWSSTSWRSSGVGRAP